jgi:hypothetical protein
MEYSPRESTLRSNVDRLALILPSLRHAAYAALPDSPYHSIFDHLSAARLIRFLGRLLSPSDRLGQVNTQLRQVDYFEHERSPLIATSLRKRRSIRYSGDTQLHADANRREVLLLLDGVRQSRMPFMLKAGFGPRAAGDPET